MNILAIETSCDETAVCLVQTQGNSAPASSVTDGHGDTSIEQPGHSAMILGNALSSQIAIHAQYGGVFPALAKRAHAEQFVPLLAHCLEQAGMLRARTSEGIDAHAEASQRTEELGMLLSELDGKESQLKASLVPFLATYEIPDIDYIAVTVGPGLAPALWVGVNAAKSLARAWNKPLIPINHMEGHVVTAMYARVAQADASNTAHTYTIQPLALPLLALLVSGGHTELVLTEQLGRYAKIGQTRDDAIGEAFDKVARMLGLAYPGGPKVSALAAAFRASGLPQTLALPRPMLHSGDYDFSYSGIKTATLYAIRDMTDGNARALTDEEKMMIACAFEDAAIEVLTHKTAKACIEHNIGTVVVGGGVAGNSYLRAMLTETLAAKAPNCVVLFPEQWLATDNAVMIALAACGQLHAGTAATPELSTVIADGNLSL